MSQEKLVGDRYRLKKKLGRRSLGDSFGAVDIQFDRTVVLEVLQGPVLATPESRLPPETTLGLKTDLERLAQIQSPYLLNVLDVQPTGRPPFLIFDPVEGDPLSTWIQGKRLAGEALEEVLEHLTRNLLDGLESLHREGTTHKDIRPATVFRTSEGDFLMSEPGMVLTPACRSVLHPSVLAQLLPFLPPEVARGEAHGPHSDLYQLGGLLRFVVTGRPPREGQPLRPMAEEAPQLREAWRIFIDELQAPQVGRRITSVAAAKEFQDMMLAEEAAQEAGLVPGAAGAGPGLPGPPDPSKVSPLRPVILALVVLGLCAGIFFRGGSKAPLPTLQSQTELGLEDLRVVWKPDGETPPVAPFSLEVQGQEPRTLTLEGDRIETRLPWAEVSDLPYRLLDSAQRVLATDRFPALQELKTAFRTSFRPDGAIEVALDCTQAVRLEARYQEDGKPREAGSKDLLRSHQVVFHPTWKQPVSAIEWKVTGPLGKQRTLAGPSEFAAFQPFFEAAFEALDKLVPKEIEQQLKEAIKSAADTAVTIEVAGWDEVLKRWKSDPLFERLRAQGDVFFTDRKQVGDEQHYRRYEDLLKLERVQTALAAVSHHEPLSIRDIYRAYCHAFTPVDRRGSRALAPGTGDSIMMQYSHPKASWLNENGAKTWPSSFETSFALPPKFYTPGARARFTLLVEDVSPLYRMELLLSFRVQGEEVARSFWFYPRRNMQALATKQVPAKTMMALEIPVDAIPREIGTLKLEIDKLGYWGGHGATTFSELLLDKIEAGEQAAVAPPEEIPESPEAAASPEE